MGFKCKFCRTGYGHNKYVGYQLQGVAGCGNCKGEFTDSNELKSTIGYFLDLKNGVQRAIDNNQIAIKDIEKSLELLKEYKESKQ